MIDACGSFSNIFISIFGIPDKNWKYSTMTAIAMVHATIISVVINMVLCFFFICFPC